MPIATYIRFKKLVKLGNNKCIMRSMGTDRWILLICHPKCPSLTRSWTNVGALFVPYMIPQATSLSLTLPSFIHELNITLHAYVVFDDRHNRHYH